MKKALLVLGLGTLILGVLPAEPLPMEPVSAGDPRKVRLTFLGDIMAHTVNFLMSDYREIYAGVAHILSADDLTFANLETEVDPSRPYATYPLFNVHPEYVEAAVNGGVDVFSLANNHSWDYKLPGLIATLQSMRGVRERAARPILFSGIREDPQEPFAPESIEMNGIRVGFLAVTQFTNDHRRHPYVHTVDYQRPEDVEPFLAWIREASRPFDLFILSYHGGREYVGQPEAAREAFFRRLVQAGVHIVYGHHPHVLQPFDRLRLGEQTRLIIHSAGNFISGMSWKVDPSNPRHPLAPMGDSLLYVVEAEFDGGGLLGMEVQPLAVSNGRNRQGEPVVQLLGTLIRQERSSLWASYYRERSRLLEPLQQPREVELSW